MKMIKGQSDCVLVMATEVAMLQKTSPQAFLFLGIPGGADISHLQKLQLPLIAAG